MRRAGIAIAVALAAIGTLTAARVLISRHGIEAAYDRVEMVVDYDEAAELAESRGVGVADLLTDLASAGVTGVALNEETLPIMVDSGRARLLDEAGNLAIEISDPPVAERVAANLRAKWPSALAEDDESRVFSFDVPLESLETVGVGWAQGPAGTVRDCGLALIARPIDSPRIDLDGLEFTFREIARFNAGRVLFAGKFVLGNGELLPTTAELLARDRLVYYAIELEAQEGTAALTALLDCQVIRTHSIGEKEMLRQSPLRAQRRFVRAARERNVRSCFVHLFLDRAMADPIAYNLAYVSGIAEGLRSAGFRLGLAQPLPPFDEGARRRVPLALGVAGGTALLAAMLLPLSATGLLVWTLIAAAGLAGLTVLEPAQGRLGAALLATLVFPILAATVLLRASERRAVGGPWSAMSHAVGLFVGAALIAGLGGLMAGALLSESAFMVKAAQFKGIKLSQLVPLVGVTAIVLLRLAEPGGTWAEYVLRVKRRFREIWNAPFTIGYALIGTVILGAGAYWILRTGNQAASTALEQERDFREALEALLVYRPRTKEFILGHPAMVLAAFLGLSGRRYLLGPCLVVGMVGLTSMVNTFCHIHSPVQASVLRTLYGLLLGLAVGLAACAASAVWWRLAGQDRSPDDPKEDHRSGAGEQGG